MEICQLPFNTMEIWTEDGCHMKLIRVCILYIAYCNCFLKPHCHLGSKGWNCYNLLQFRELIEVTDKQMPVTHIIFIATNNKNGLDDNIAKYHMFDPHCVDWNYKNKVGRWAKKTRRLVNNQVNGKSQNNYIISNCQLTLLDSDHKTWSDLTWYFLKSASTR